MLATGPDINVHVNDVIVSYDDYGNGPVPLLFIHGFPFDRTMWQPQLDFLKQVYRVIAFDLRGFGKSTSGREKFSVTLFADDVIGFMDNLQLEKVILCGLSMGGYIALNAIDRYPQRFAGVILCDTQCIADSPEAKDKRYKTIAHIEAKGLEEFSEGFLKNLFTKEFISSNNGWVNRIRNTIRNTSPETVIFTLKALAERWETCSALDSFNIPALILCGKEDVITPPAQSESMHGLLRGSELRLLEGAAHLPNLEQPDVFNKSILNFVRSLHPDEK